MFAMYSMRKAVSTVRNYSYGRTDEPGHHVTSQLASHESLSHILVPPHCYLTRYTLNPRVLDPRVLDSRIPNPRILNPRILNPRILSPRMLNPSILKPQHTQS